MKYSAGMISSSFWFLESRKIAELMLDGNSKEEITKIALKDNLFQVESERRVRTITNGVYRRLEMFPDELLEYFIKVDVNSAKIFVLISVLKTDKLFFEFMHEVFREHILLGNFTLKNRDFDIFFDNKSYQSEIINGWVDETVERLKRGYKNMLSEAAVLDTSGNENIIKIPFVDLKFRDVLIEYDLGPYLNAIIGE